MIRDFGRHWWLQIFLSKSRYANRVFVNSKLSISRVPLSCVQLRSVAFIVEVALEWLQWHYAVGLSEKAKPGLTAGGGPASCNVKSPCQSWLSSGTGSMSRSSIPCSGELSRKICRWALNDSLKSLFILDSLQGGRPKRSTWPLYRRFFLNTSLNDSLKSLFILDSLQIWSKAKRFAGELLVSLKSLLLDIVLWWSNANKLLLVCSDHQWVTTGLWSSYKWVDQ